MEHKYERWLAGSPHAFVDSFVAEAMSYHMRRRELFADTARLVHRIVPDRTQQQEILLQLAVLLGDLACSSYKKSVLDASLSGLPTLPSGVALPGVLQPSTRVQSID